MDFSVWVILKCNLLYYKITGKYAYNYYFFGGGRWGGGTTDRQTFEIKRQESIVNF